MSQVETISPRARRLLRSEHLWVPLFFLVLSWAVRFGSFSGWLDASYAGDLAEDSGQFIWHFLHMWRALTGQADLFFSDQVFYPVGLQMVRQDWAPTAALLALPFQLVGPLFALNMQILLAFAMCGYFAYLLARHLSGDRLFALMAGVIFAFCEFRMDKSFGHINQANQQFVPLYLLFLVRYFQVNSGRGLDAVGAAVCFYLATFCTYYQLVFVLLLTVFFLIFQAGAAVASPQRAARLAALARRTLGFGFICAGACLLLFGPLLFNYWQAFMEAARSLTYYMPEYSADILSYAQSNLYVTPSERIFTSEGGTAFMGYSVLALTLVSMGLVWRRTGAGPWVFMVLVFFVISLGSTLMYAGKPVGELFVFDLLQALPVIQGAKVAARFSSLVILCAAMAAAITMAHIDRSWLTSWSRNSRLLLKGGVVVFTCAELLIPPAKFVQQGLPTPFHVPHAYRAVARAPGDPALLQFPLCWDAFTGNIGPHRFPRQFFAYQTLHGKPIFSGIGNMVPATTLRYLLRLPLVGELIHIGKGEKLQDRGETKAQRLADANQVVGTLDLRHILLYKELRIPGGDRVPEHYQAALKYLHETLFVRPAMEDGSLMLLNVKQPDSAARQGPQSIGFDRRGSLVHLGGGFRRVKRAQVWQAEAALDNDEEKELYFRLAQGRADTLVFSQRCILGPCRMRVILNERFVGTVEAGAEWGEQRVRLHRGLVRKGVNRLRLEPEDSVQEELQIPVGRTGVKSPVGLVVRSAGLRAGNQAEVFVGRRSLVPNSRGYNMAVLHPRSGEVVAAQAFDLVDDPGGRNARLMVAFIKAIPPGMIVAVAVKDDGSIGLTAQAVLALGTLGGKADLRHKLRTSHALLGVKGAAPGTAMELVSTEAVEIVLARQLQIRRIKLLGK